MENNGQGTSLSDHMASAFPGGASDGNPASDGGSVLSGGLDGGDGTQGQATSVDPVAAFLGEDPTPTGGGTPNADGGKITLSVDADMVIGQDADGKPITAAEVQRSFLREADYTRKTMDIADIRKKAEQFDAFVNENAQILSDLDSGDPNRLMRGLQEIARARGADLNSLLGGQDRPRGPDGRFVSAKTEEFKKIDLDDLVPGTDEYRMASTINALVDRLAANPELAELKSQLAQQQQFFESLQQGIQAQQSRSAMEQIAARWASAQVPFKGVDIDGALELVGKPISPEQAMMLHHMSGYMRHLLAIAQKNTATPNVMGEPAGGTGGPVNPEGMSLLGFMQRRFGG